MVNIANISLCNCNDIHPNKLTKHLKFEKRLKNNTFDVATLFIQHELVSIAFKSFQKKWNRGSVSTIDALQQFWEGLLEWKPILASVLHLLLESSSGLEMLLNKTPKQFKIGWGFIEILDLKCRINYKLRKLL